MKHAKMMFNAANGDMAPIGRRFVKCHMALDIKQKDFRRKARLLLQQLLMQVWSHTRQFAQP